MLQALLNIFKIPELRTRVLFTLGMIVVYRIGFWIPLPGVSQTLIKEAAQNASEGDGGFGRLVDYMSIFSGGSLSQSTIFGLGIMPYITASIIFQLLQTAVPRLQELKKEGASGQQKITEWTRYATIAMCVIQSFMWIQYMLSANLIEPEFTTTNGKLILFFAGVTGLTAGSIFLMWLGEQIDKYGIGNGVSLIITAGILAQMPSAVNWLLQNSPIGALPVLRDVYGVDITNDPQLAWTGVMMVVGLFFFVTAGAVLITVAQRRIPVQQAKHTRGRRVFGGQRSFLPLKINQGGVMPIIFASSLMIFPSILFSALAGQAQNAESAQWWISTTNFLSDEFQMGAFPYLIVYVAMVYFFSYFWTTVSFNPDDVAKQLRDYGSFIPGLRPGPRTAEYLETVLERVTYVGAGFLAIIAVIPMVAQNALAIPFNVSNFLGGTGLLIVVAVGLDFIQRIEANLLMRNYSGFLGDAEPGSSGTPRSTGGG